MNKHFILQPVELRADEAADRASRNFYAESDRPSQDAIVDSRNHPYMGIIPWDVTNFSVGSMRDLPELFRVDRERIYSNIKDVTWSSYRSFITSAACIAYIEDEFRCVLANVNGVEETLRIEIIEGANHTIRLHQFLSNVTRNKFVLKRNSDLADLLEIPSMMSTCISNDNFDDALDLEAFLDKMSNLRPCLGTVKELLWNITGSTMLMLMKLLEKLRCNCQLSDSLRIVGHLRRLSIFTEIDLRSNYLNCRESWLGNVHLEFEHQFGGSQIEQRHMDAYEEGKKLTDKVRISLFEVIMQYRTIFGMDEFTCEIDDSGLLNSWAMRYVLKYLYSLQKLLPHIAGGANYASLYDHCMYCGVGLGRVGLDIRYSLTPIFLKSAELRFRRAMMNAVENLESSLRHQRWITLRSYSTISTLTHGSEAGHHPKTDLNSPPLDLMDHPPLAVFSNCIIQGINDLRHINPLALQDVVLEHLLEALETASLVIFQCHESSFIREHEVDLYLNLCNAARDNAFPYLLDCVRNLYPEIASKPGHTDLSMRRILRPLSSALTALHNFPYINLFKIANHENDAKEIG